jgi:hypothetical protein
MNEVLKDGPWAGFQIVHTYTRAQAISDGVLIDLTSSFPNETRMYRWNVCCTDSVWSLIERAAESDSTEVAVYVWDVCYMSHMAIAALRDSGHPELYFKVCLPLGTPKKKLKMVSGPISFDDPTPCLTIMLPTED